MRKWLIATEAFLVHGVEGAILGLAYGTIPYLIQSRVTVMELGLFMVVTLPYATKEILAALTRALFPWIKAGCVLILLALGLGLVHIADEFEERMVHGDVLRLILIVFALVTVATAADCSMESWAHRQGVKLSTSRDIGRSLGAFVSFPVYFLLRDPALLFHLFNVDTKHNGVEILTLDQILYACAFASLTSLVFVLLTPTDPVASSDSRYPSLRETIERTYTLWTCRSIRAFTGLLFFWRLPFIAVTFLAPLKLLDKGLQIELLALFWSMSIVPGYLSGVLALYWKRASLPRTLWIVMFNLQLLVGFCMTYILSRIPNDIILSVHYIYVLAYFSAMLVSFFIANVMFVTLERLIVMLVDREDLLTRSLFQGVATLGGCFWRVVIFIFSELTSVRICHRQSQPFYDVPCPLNPPFGVSMNNLCTDSGGECVVIRDGFFFVSYTMLAIGLFLSIYFTRILSRMPRSKKD